MKEQLIEFETAKLAKLKGFIVEVPNYYHPKYGLDDDEYGHKDNYNSPAWSEGYYSAPTQSLLQKWLRDEHDIDVYIIPNGMRDKDINDRLYHPQLWVKDLYQTELHSKKTYEQALEQGLINALNLIK